MNYRDFSHWEVDNLNDGFIFFVQRLNELLFDYTIDTYKPMALNSPYLCAEAVRIISEIESDNIDKNNILPIIEELELVLSKDIVAKQLINTDIHYYTNYDESTNTLVDLKLRLEVLERTLGISRYLTINNNLLLKAVEENSKDKIGYLARNLLTTCINWGMSKKYLYDVFNKFFFDKKKKIDNISSIKDFLILIAPKIHNFDVYFRVSKNFELVSDSFKFFNISFVEENSGDETEDKYYSEVVKKTKKIGNVSEVVKISNISSSDPYTARDKAERRLETLKNTSQFYFHKSHLIWDAGALVIQSCCKVERTFTFKAINPMLKAFNFKGNDIAKQTNKVFRGIALRGESFQKFNRAIELHSNSFHNITFENQLVNLWTIFETIIPSNTKKSKIRNVIDNSLPILKRRYIPFLIKTLYQDCKRWNKSLLLNYLDKVDVDEDSRHLKFIKLLGDSELERLRKEFYVEMGDFHLLRNRFFKLSKIISSSEKTLAEIDRHSQNVNWQLRRIYRSRNLIVHSGKNLANTNILIENTHDYIDQIISELITFTTTIYYVKTIEQSFEISKLLYGNFEKVLKESSSFSDYFSVLLNDENKFL